MHQGARGVVKVGQVSASDQSLLKQRKKPNQTKQYKTKQKPICKLMLCTEVLGVLLINSYAAELLRVVLIKQLCTEVLGVLLIKQLCSRAAESGADWTAMH